jgi:RNA polymerase sigma-70 factor (ECF subfamily)
VNLNGHDGVFTGAGLFLPPPFPRVAIEKTREDEAPGAAPDIARLTSRMAKNDEAAWRMFYELYFNRLLGYLLVVTAGREEAAREALQATLVRVVRHIRRFEAEPVFWSWLTVLARSSVVDAERKRSRYAALLERFFQSEPAAEPADPETEGRLQRLLEKNLAGLGAADRVLIEQKYFNGASVRDIAADTGATEKSVESRLVRIRRQLRETILSALKHEK